ncbi:MAG: PKD domain-containing protein [Flavobacteriales bacterium]
MAPGLLAAQLYGVQRNGEDATYQGCDSSQIVNFTDSLLGDLTYRFEPDIIPGATNVFGTVWSVYDGSFLQAYGSEYDHVFPAPGEHLVCLTVNAFDLVTQQPCSTTVCRLQYMYQDESCVDLVPDFSISAVAGQAITFVNESSYQAIDVVGGTWSFGDASLAAGAEVTHEFQGTGPFEVCLTVTLDGPVGCTATVCKWLYLGPVPVECDTLLDPGFLMVQQMDLVGALDTSITSGMDHSITWDLGDDSPLQLGRYTVHSYPADGSYELCNTVRIWGPLLADTCARTVCRTVLVMTAVGMDEEEDRSDQLTAWPVPAQQEVMLSGLEPGAARLEVYDSGGRLALERSVHVVQLALLDLGALPAGVYTVRSLQASGHRVVRVLKE